MRAPWCLSTAAPGSTHWNSSIQTYGGGGSSLGAEQCDSSQTWSYLDGYAHWDEDVGAALCSAPEKTREEDGVDMGHGTSFSIAWANSKVYL